MIMVGARHFLIPRAAIAKIMPRQDICLFEQPDGSIDCGDADSCIDRSGAPINLLYVGMIGGCREYTGNHSALFGHLQTLVEAELLQPRDHRISIVAWLIRRYHTRMRTQSLRPEGHRCSRARPQHDYEASIPVRPADAALASRGLFPSRADCAGGRSWAPPSGSRSAAPSAHDRIRVSCCKLSSGVVSASSTSC